MPGSVQPGHSHCGVRSRKSLSSSGFTRMSSWSIAMPALLTRMCSPPRSLASLLTDASTCSGSDTSNLAITPSEPACFTRSRVSAAATTSISSSRGCSSAGLARRKVASRSAKARVGDDSASAGRTQAALSSIRLEVSGAAPPSAAAGARWACGSGPRWCRRRRAQGRCAHGPPRRWR